MTDAFNSMSNSIFDNILFNNEEIELDMKDVWKNDLNIDDITLIPNLKEFCELNNFSWNEMEMIYDPMIKPEVVQHDCMWSGTCIDKSHPMKKKITRNHSILEDDEMEEEDDRESEMELTLKNNLPSIFLPMNHHHQDASRAAPTNLSREITAADIFNAPIIILPDSPSLNQHTIQNDARVLNPNPPPPQLQKVYYNCPSLHQIKVETIEMEPIQSQVKAEMCDEQIQIIPYYPIAPPTVKREVSPPPLIIYQNNVEMFNKMNYQNNHINYMTSYMDTNNNNLPKWQNFQPSQYSNINRMHFFNGDSMKSNCGQQKKRKYAKKNTRNNYKKKKSVIKAEKKKNVIIEKKVINYAGSIQSSSTQGDVSTDEDPIKKYKNHNYMERQRRIGLKNLFIELKQTIPDLSDKERVPKVNILRAATDYCRKIKNEELELINLKKNNARLIGKFKKLNKIYSY